MFNCLKMKPAQKVSLHIGVNKYDNAYYGGDISLSQCVYDAQRLGEYAARRGYRAKAIYDHNATLENFKSLMKEQADKLRKGDFLCVSDSSHGTYDDLFENGKTKRATAICLHDGILWDYEFRELLKAFRVGVTVIWISDCCFAESNWRFVRDPLPYNNAKARFVRLPEYPGIPMGATQGDKRQIRCKMFTYSSSNIYQVSYEDEKGGVFTTAMLNALEAEPNLTYHQLWRRTSEIIAPLYPQSPVFENVRAANFTGNRFLE